MDERRNDWNRLARGRPSTAGVRDSETRRALDANNQNIDYLIRKVQDIVKRPDDDKFPKTDVSKRPSDKEDSRKPQVVMVSGMWNEPASADLRAIVNPMGMDTTCYFRYGLDKSLGSSSGSVSAGSGEVGESVLVNVDSLSVPATYFAQVVATNSEGTSYSNIVTFDTGKKPEVTI